jgi:ABC-type multidrug transport system ATPase subunit
VSGEAVFEVEHLTKRYRRAAQPANDDISFAIPPGQFFGIFGPNGAGKTTLVRQLTALLQPTAGSIRLFGHDVIQNPGLVPKWVGYYGQKIAALRHFKLQEVLAITGIFRGLPTAEARRQALALIERFELGPLADSRLSSVSGGEQRLAVLLATFVGSPSVLVLDEPTNELDPIRRRTLWEYLRAYTADQGATVVLTTHNLSEAEGIVERVALIDGGKLVVLATPGELKRQIADQVRLDVTLRLAHVSDAEERLAGLPGSRQVRPGRWEIVAPQERATALLPQVVQLVGIEALDDFRLITPTLEDVYVHFTGHAWQHDESQG